MKSFIDKETKFLSVPFEVEEAKIKDKDGEQYGFVKGYGSTFGNIDRGYDRILKGAFKDTLERHDAKKRQIRMKFDHWDLVGGWPVYKETNKGLYLEGNINLKVQKGEEAYNLAKQGVLTDLSIGYRATDIDWVKEKVGEKDGNDIIIRVRNIKALELYEVSLVDEPMNTLANITGVKNCHTITDVSKLLKSRGFSNREANEIVYLIKTLSRNEDEEDTRNEIIDKIDSIKTVNYLDNIINNIRRGL